VAPPGENVLRGSGAGEKETLDQQEGDLRQNAFVRKKGRAAKKDYGPQPTTDHYGEAKVRRSNSGQELKIRAKPTTEEDDVGKSIFVFFLLGPGPEGRSASNNNKNSR